MRRTSMSWSCQSDHPGGHVGGDEDMVEAAENGGSEGAGVGGHEVFLWAWVEDHGFNAGRMVRRLA